MCLSCSKKKKYVVFCVHLITPSPSTAFNIQRDVVFFVENIFTTISIWHGNTEHG